MKGRVSLGTDTRPSIGSVTYDISFNSSLFSYSEHFGPAHGTYALSGRPAVLHDYAFGVLHFPFGTAFHTVRLHMFTSLFIKA
jgi:hypothetical protein